MAQQQNNTNSVIITLTWPRL